LNGGKAFHAIQEISKGEKGERKFSTSFNPLSKGGGKEKIKLIFPSSHSKYGGGEQRSPIIRLAKRRKS